MKRPPPRSHLQAQMFAERQQLAVTRTPVPRYGQLAAGFTQPQLQTRRQRVAGAPRCAGLVGVPHTHLTCTQDAAFTRRLFKKKTKNKNKPKIIQNGNDLQRCEPTFCLKLLHAGVDGVPALLETNKQLFVFKNMVVGRSHQKKK